MKNNLKYFLLLLSLPVVLSAQYTGGSGRGDALLTISSQALPVELTSFTASTEKNGVTLNWKTATETNNYGFEIQRSVVSSQQSGNVWSKIGFVEGNGTTNAPKSYSSPTNPQTEKYRID